MKKSEECQGFVVLTIVLSFMSACYAHHGVDVDDPTKGFTAVPLTVRNIHMDKPYNEPLKQRYSDKDGVRKFRVYNHDKPFKPSSQTRPRTEVRITGYDYTSGVWQFEGTFVVPSGTNGVCIFQVFGASNSGHATTLQLRVYGGNLWIYRDQIVASNIFDQPFKLNVIHDVGNSKVTVFINGKQQAQVGGRGPSSHYFKFGVYAQEDSSNIMESRWSLVRVLKK